jgi:tellurite resistance protein TerC
MGVVDTVGTPALWAGFIAFVLAMLALDLGVMQRRAHTPSLREAAGWSAFWIALALVFGAGVWHFAGADTATEYLTAYVVEKSLSVDNLFVFLLVFGTLGIPTQYQHRVLFWGILGALVLRAAMILAGTALLSRFHWLLYVFGGVLILGGIKLLREFREGDREVHQERGPLLRFIERVLPVTQTLSGQALTARENGRLVATPLLTALVFVEISDVVFALDSIPAIFAITLDPFVVFTSNVFAILGLRSLYFLLARVMHRLHALKIGLAAVLVFVGVKMLLIDVVHVPPAVSLGVITTLLGIPVLVALRRGLPPAASPDAPAPPPAAPLAQPPPP